MVFSILPLADALLRRSFIASGLRARTVAVDDDTTIHCWISAALAPQNGKPNPNPKSGSKPVILLIHGFGPSAMWQWRAQVAALAGRFDLVVPDLIFFGGSSTRSPLRSEAYQAAALARLLDALGVRRLAAAAGTSYGGFVAYHLARALGPARVARVVVASSDLLKSDDDDRAFLGRGAAAGVAAERVADLMLPGDVATIRALMGLAFYRPPRFVPDFVLRDIIRVGAFPNFLILISLRFRSFHILVFFLFLHFFRLI